MAFLAGNNRNNRINGTDEDDAIRGLGGDDTIFGGDGSDEIYGDAGNDRINPGSNTGEDLLWAGSGDDRYDFAQTLPEDNSAFFLLDYRKLEGPIATSIGRRGGTVDKGSDGTDRIVNLQTDSSIWGFGISSTAGDDTIKIGLARDVFVFIGDQGGNDLYIGGESFDRLDYSPRALGAVEVRVQGYSDGGMRGVAVGEDGTRDVFRNIDEVRGSRDTDRLIGGAQRDRFMPDAGDDFMDGKGGIDLVRFDRANAISLEANLARGTAELTYDRDFARFGTWFQTLRSIEDVRGTDGDDTVTGSRVANRIEGRSGDDLIKGAGGADALLGEFGDDTLRGGGGGDRLEGGEGANTLFGNGGADTFVLTFEDDRQLIRDFRDGTDRIELPNGVRFADLTFTAAGGDVAIEGGGVSALVHDASVADFARGDFILT